MSTKIFYDNGSAYSVEAAAVILNKYPDATLTNCNGKDATAMTALVTATGTFTNIFTAVRADYVAETLPTCTFTCTHIGANDDIVEIWVNNGTNNILIGSYKVVLAGGDTTTTTAQAIKATINGNVNGFKAAGGADILTITAPVGSGVLYNSCVVTLIFGLTPTITATKTNFGATGVAAVGVQNTGSFTAANAATLSGKATTFYNVAVATLLYGEIEQAWRLIYQTKTVPYIVRLLGGNGLTATETIEANNLRETLYNLTYNTVDKYQPFWKRLIDWDNTASDLTTKSTGQDLTLLDYMTGRYVVEHYITGK